MLGQGLRECWQAMQQRWRARRKDSQCVAVDLDSTWVTRFEMRLAEALHADDVWFQLHAEAAEQAGLVGQAMAIDFTSVHDGQRAEVLYRVSAVPWVLLKQVQSTLQAMGWHLSRLGVYEKQNDAAMPATSINFLPHRQMRLQHLKRQLCWRWGMALLCGLLVAQALRMVLTMAVSQMGAEETAQVLAQQTQRETQAQHDALQLEWQQRKAAQTQLQAHRTQQQQSLQWQAVLQANSSAVWFEQLSQEGAAWRLLGQALSQNDVDHLQAKLGALSIWQTPPALKQWSSLPPSPEVRMPLWQFELVGVLRDIKRIDAVSQRASTKTQDTSDSRVAP